MYQLPMVIGTAIQTGLSAARAGKLAQIGARIGVAADASKIMAAVKSSPVMAAIVIVELYGAASEWLAKLVSDQPEIANMNLASFKDLGYKHTVPGSDDTKSSIGGNVQYADEFAMITEAATFLNGMDNLITLKNVLALPQIIWEARGEAVVLAKTLTAAEKRA